jgi:hypothetical protein
VHNIGQPLGIDKQLTTLQQGIRRGNKLGFPTAEWRAQSRVIEPGQHFAQHAQPSAPLGALAPNRG